MTPPAATAKLIHDLVTGSHSEGITNLAVECAITHHNRILLLVEPGRDFIDDTWQLPIGPVLPGETLDDALCRNLAGLGLTLDEMTGYTGHHDHHDPNGETIRTFCFAATVTDPDSICRTASIGHCWVDPADLPELSSV